MAKMLKGIVAEPLPLAVGELYEIISLDRLTLAVCTLVTEQDNDIAVILPLDLLDRIEFQYLAYGLLLDSYMVYYFHLYQILETENGRRRT